MRERKNRNFDNLWARHSAEWRDSAQIASQWREAGALDICLLKSRVSGKWWETLSRLRVTLLVTREYEHLVVAMTAGGGSPRTTFFPVPHPSGLVVDRAKGCVFLASTRNPNQIYTFKPATGSLERADVTPKFCVHAPLMPVTTKFYPGCLYLHDLALLSGILHANAVGHNAVVRLGAEGEFQRVWWPSCIEVNGKPVFAKNHIQLNSIAADRSPEDSFFSASSCIVSRVRPGHLNYRVDKRGVIFSGRTREPVCTDLTRPHSARLHDGRVWVANSGYGEIGFIRDGKLEVVQKLPGWTRGLCLVQDVAFIGTSRVIPRYARYAPGLSPSRSHCAVYVVSIKTGEVLGALEWPYGNQVFAIDWISEDASGGFLFDARSRRHTQKIAFFYAYTTN